MTRPTADIARELVAQWMTTAAGGTAHGAGVLEHFITAALEQARAEAIEEAAKVADRIANITARGHSPKTQKTGHMLEALGTAEWISCDIRALAQRRATKEG